MLSQIPRDPRALHRLADVHGGYLNLFRWGSLFYGQAPLLYLARRHTRHARVVFISGTQGKTTLLRAVRHLLGRPVDNWSNSNTNCRGEVPWSALRIPRRISTIPLEVPDGAHDFHAFAEALHPQSAIVLNVGREHVAILGSLHAAAAQFGDLLARLPASGWAVVNADDRLLSGLPTAARVMTFGRSPAADVRIVHATRVQGRLLVQLDVAGRRVAAHTQLVGLHYQHVVAAYFAWALTAGFDPAMAAQVLRTLPVTPSRMQPFTSSRGAMILSDDYKATPETVRAGLAEVAAWPAATKWAVLGELTNFPAAHADSEYLAVAQAAARATDQVVTFGQGWAQHAGVWDGLDVRVRHRPSVLDAAEPVQAEHGPHDLIYIKGTEDVRPRRITLRLAGVAVTCAKTECKKTLVLCEKCRELTR